MPVPMQRATMQEPDRILHFVMCDDVTLTAALILYVHHVLTHLRPGLMNAPTMYLTFAPNTSHGLQGDHLNHGSLRAKTRVRANLSDPTLPLNLTLNLTLGRTLGRTITITRHHLGGLTLTLTLSLVPTLTLTLTLKP